jgi:tetratricopeptide (TPR) repeat protein
MDSKKNNADTVHSTSIDPTVIVQVEEALARARKHFTDEDFSQALFLLDAVLKTNPYLEGAQELRNQIQQKAEARGRELFEEGLNSYMEYDWDRATTFFKKSLQIVPDDPASVEWIQKAARRKEHGRFERRYSTNWQECGKLLSGRTYVVAEERLKLLIT